MKHITYVEDQGGKKYLRFEEAAEITPNSIYWAVEQMIKGQTVHRTGYVSSNGGILWNFAMDNYGKITLHYESGERAYIPPMLVHEFIRAFKNTGARWDVCNTQSINTSCVPRESFAEMVKRSKHEETSKSKDKGGAICPMILTK